MSAYEKLLDPTYNPGGRSVIRIPRKVQGVVVEVYSPACTIQREKARKAAERLGVTRAAFDRDRADWRRYRSLQEAEMDGYVEVIPEPDGARVVILNGDVINIILS